MDGVMNKTRFAIKRCRDKTNKETNSIKQKDF